MANIIGTFVNSENFLNSLNATATNDIYVINNVALEDLATQANSQLSTIATTGNFGDLETPPTKAQLLEILELSDSGTAYTNHVDWANVDNKPNDLGGGGSVPTNISAFTNDIGYITSYTETDPIFSTSPAATITSEMITEWDGNTSAISTHTADIATNLASIQALQLDIPRIDNALASKKEILQIDVTAAPYNLNQFGQSSFVLAYDVLTTTILNNYLSKEIIVQSNGGNYNLTSLNVSDDYTFIIFEKKQLNYVALKNNCTQDPGETNEAYEVRLNNYIFDNINDSYNKVYYIHDVQRNIVYCIFKTGTYVNMAKLEELLANVGD